MEHTAQATFELGLLLLLAALAGKAARAIGLPAVMGYLAVGVAVSPFTPGYVADREQLALLADVGVVLLLFEVGRHRALERRHAAAGIRPRLRPFTTSRRLGLVRRHGDRHALDLTPADRRRSSRTCWPIPGWARNRSS